MDQPLGVIEQRVPNRNPLFYDSQWPYEDGFKAWTLRKQRPGLHVIEKRAASDIRQ